ncbi:MAG TPA: transglycosylase SLT domain-containing protein [Alphaproteobacteria bacterium]|nr:transglycosylase SLT domain-containing protein [Alphaproteobacteria bacterium]
MIKVVFAFLAVFGSLQASGLKSPKITRKKITSCQHVCCEQIFEEQEKAKGLPEGLLQAISKVESNYSPFAINAKGRAYYFDTKQEAAEFIRSLRSQGIQNINIGYMQLNYASHRGQFSSEEEMLEPESNIAYAAKLLKKLSSRHGVEKAVKLYHSPNENHHNPYKNKVYSHWGQIKRKPSFGKLEDKKVQKVSFKKQVKKQNFGANIPEQNLQFVQERQKYERKPLGGIGWSDRQLTNTLSGYLVTQGE